VGTQALGEEISNQRWQVQDTVVLGADLITYEPFYALRILPPSDGDNFPGVMELQAKYHPFQALVNYLDVDPPLSSTTQFSNCSYKTLFKFWSE